MTKHDPLLMPRFIRPETNRRALAIITMALEAAELERTIEAALAELMRRLYSDRYGGP